MNNLTKLKISTTQLVVLLFAITLGVAIGYLLLSDKEYTFKKILFANILILHYLVCLYFLYKLFTRRYPIQVKTKSLDEDINDLETQLSQQYKKINNEHISPEEKAKLEKSIAESSKQLNIIKSIVQENKEKNFKIKLLNEKIRNAFQGIRQVNSAVYLEHRRLERLYLFYLVASIIIVVSLFIEVTCICYKIHTVHEYPDIKEYLPLIIPIPIAVGLLYGFITQMNRAQIQMVQLAKEMCETSYTEELMLATNTLAQDLDEGIYKVNKAIDKLLEKNINADSNVPKSMDSLCRLVEKEGSINIIVDILKQAIIFLEKKKE